MALIKGVISFGSNFNIGNKGPIDSRMRVEFISDLTSVWTKEIPAFRGMFVSVLEDANMYILIADDATQAENWKKIGADGALTVDKYSEAVAKADNSNLGQIIYVKQNEEVPNPDDSGTTMTYTAGPYIVNGKNSIAKLGTTTPTGDLEGEVNNLSGEVSTLKNDMSTVKGKVSTLEAKVGTLENDTTHILGGDDIE